MEQRSKVALLTGSSGGVGKVILHMLLEDNVICYLPVRDKNKIFQLPFYSKYSHLINIFEFDLTSLQLIEEMYKNIYKKHGYIDILINNAAVLYHSDIDNIDIDKWEYSFRVNVTVPMVMCRQFIRDNNTKEGIIINISSIAGVHGFSKMPQLLSYTVTKSSIITLGECFAQECRNKGFNIITVSPGSMDTAMFRKNFKGTAKIKTESFAKFVYLLLKLNDKNLCGNNIIYNGL